MSDHVITDAEHGQRVRRVTFARRVFIVAGLIYGAAIPAMLLVIVTGIEEQQDSNVSKITETRRNTELIESCTTPTGECYRRGQETTASAVGTINQVVTYAAVYAAACADQPDVQTVDQIERCVTDRLDKKLRPPG